MAQKLNPHDARTHHSAGILTVHIFGTQVDPQRPRCRCLVAKPGPSTSEWLPHDLTLIDLEEWPHWFVGGWILFAIDVADEPALEVWMANHQEH